MGWFKKQDDLNRGLMWLGLGCLLIAFVFGGNRSVSTVFRLLFALCALTFVLRAFSGQPQKRYQENLIYLRFVTGVRERFASAKRWVQDKTAKSGGGQSSFSPKQYWQTRRQYRYLTCGQCGQKLRVPRGKGKIRVTCTKCRNQFLAKS